MVRRWHTHRESANAKTTEALALRQPECQPRRVANNVSTVVQDPLFTQTGAAALAAATAAWSGAVAAAQAGQTPVDPLRIAAGVRAANPQLPAELISSALTQARLRHRAIGRLGAEALELFLTPDGLEQATRPAVADLRARQLQAAGIDHVIDLGAGLGLDSRAFARAGLRVDAVESDPPTAAMLRANLAQFTDTARVHQDDATNMTWRSLLTPTSACFVDPGRRANGRRLHQPESWSPPWSWLTAVGREWPATVAKLAPGIPRDLAPDGAQTVWTSDSGDLVEAAIWWPDLAGPESRVAVVLRPGSSAQLDSGQDVVPPVGAPGRWLIEPDDAVIRAGLVGALTDRIDGRLLDARVAYITADGDPGAAAPFGRIWVVLDSLPFSVNAVRKRLDSMGVSRIVVKKRAFAADPDQIARSLHRVGGPEAHTLFLCRIGSSPWAIIAGPEVRNQD